MVRSIRDAVPLVPGPEARLKSRLYRWEAPLARRKDIQHEAARLTTGQINRRRFVMSALATGVTMPTAMSLASRAEAAGPRRGGHLRMAVPRGAEAEALIAAAIGNTLTERGAGDTVTGDLAERYVSDRDGLRWVFDLRPEVVFQDGMALEAQHVVDALTKAPLPDHVATIGTDGEHRIVVTLDRPDPGLAETLSAPRFAIFRDGEDGNPVGTGGYRQVQAGDSSVDLVRVDTYWKAGRAHIDRATLHLIDDPADRQAAVMSGKVDYAAPMQAETMAFLNNLPEVEFATFRATAALLVDAPSGNDEARRAIRWLQSAISRPDLIDRVLLGHGEVGDDTALRPVNAREFTSGDVGSLAPPRAIAMDPANADGFARTLASMAAPLGLGLDIGSTADAALRARVVPTEDIATSVNWDDEVYLPAWINGLAAHSTRLRHGQLAEGCPNDADRVIERWWFS